MSLTHHYEVDVRWTGNSGSGTSRYGAYRRTHDVSAKGKAVINASADPAFRGDAELWNPDELLVASLSQCHMLTYLALCALEGVVVTAYRDRATGTMAVIPRGGGHFVEVDLHPVVVVARRDMVERASELHTRAHEDCYVAASVNFPVHHYPTIEADGSAEG